MNQINLTGRITKGLELRNTNNGSSVCEFSLAVNRPKQKDKEQEADFITCQVWKQQAENLVKYQGKGSLIAVSGSLRVDAYNNAEGERRYRTYVLANNIEYLSSKPKEEKELSQTDIVQAAINEVEDPFKDFNTELTDDDLPF